MANIINFSQEKVYIFFLMNFDLMSTLIPIMSNTAKFAG